jgi:recombination protein RecT
MTQVNQTPATTTAPNGNGIKKFAETTLDVVIQKVTAFESAGQIKLPANYSAENALRSAWLILQDVKDLNKQPALTVCTSDSVANAMLDMALQGLNPVKKQCYFIVYGNKLVLQKSYIGNIAISKRVANVKEVKALPIYKGDDFAYEINLETGRKKVTKHVQEFENIDPENTTGAYAIITENNGNVWCEIMNMKQIKAAWEMGQAKGNSKAHQGFKDEMACKTVINRALKIAVGSSDDADLFDEEVLTDNRFTASVKQEIADNANGAANREAIGFDDIDHTVQGSNDGTDVGEQPAQFTNTPEPVLAQQSQSKTGQQIKADF